MCYERRADGFSRSETEALLPRLKFAETGPSFTTGKTYQAGCTCDGFFSRHQCRAENSDY